MTKPIRLVSRWERFKRSTIWHPLNTDPTDSYRHGPRFWYPTFDFIMFLLGIYAFELGSPLLNKLFPMWFVDSLGMAIAAAAVCAGVGVVFPALYLVELLGKMTMVFLLGGYAGTVAVLSPNAGENGFVVGVLFALVWLLGPRLSWLYLRLGQDYAVWRARRKHKATLKGAR